MTWKARLKTEIRLTSPEGDTFTTLWAGNPRNFERRLAFFNYPRIDGTIIQDLGAGAVTYPLTLLFEGENNDLEANRFLVSCKQAGVWSVDHPTKGLLFLQLISIREDVFPIQSGNVTTIETDWIEPLIDEAEKSEAEKRFELSKGVDNVNSSGATQLTETVKQNKATQVYTFATNVQKNVTAVTDKLKNLYERAAEVNAQISAVRRSITDTINQTVIDVTALAGEVQQLVQLPTLVSEDIQARLGYYSELGEELLGLSPEGTTEDDRNAVAIQEAALVATMGAVAQIAASGTLKTRKEALDTLETVDGLFNSIVNELDLVQSQFSAVDIDNQYFSQTSSYSDLVLLVANTLKYLLDASYDLAIEKTIVLSKPRAPIEITITEYGELGAKDENFDLFIDSNRLKGNEILILPAGKEVVVYV